MASTLVSIVIPVYNGSNYLDQAIKSALGQTYSNLEIIVVNDGSSDGGKTREIALKYGALIRYFEKKNGGVSSALNFGIREMRGEWFAWLSHDDLFDPSRITSDIEILKGGSHLVSYCKWCHIDEANMIVLTPAGFPPFLRSPREVMEMGGVDLCTMTINRKCFDRVGLFNQFNRTMQDVEMGVRLAVYFDFIHNPNSVTFRRVHQESGTVRLRSLHRRDERELGFFFRNRLSPATYSRDLVKQGNVPTISRAYAECLAAYGREGAAILFLMASLPLAFTCRASGSNSIVSTLRLLASLIWGRTLRGLPHAISRWSSNVQFIKRPSLQGAADGERKKERVYEKKM